MEEQRKERTIDELAAENDALRKKADELNKEIEYLQQQVNILYPCYELNTNIFFGPV